MTILSDWFLQITVILHFFVINYELIDDLLIIILFEKTIFTFIIFIPYH